MAGKAEAGLLGTVHVLGRSHKAPGHRKDKQRDKREHLSGPAHRKPGCADHNRNKHDGDGEQYQK